MNRNPRRGPRVRALPRPLALTLLAVPAVLFLLGCASGPRAAPVTAADTPDARSFVLDASRHDQVLVLSGGGQFGAFGAGVLSGWTQRGDRPLFDVVTGISTGALMATFAFLGTPEDDAALADVYTTTRRRDVYRYHYFVALPFTNSTATGDPLARLIARRITPELVDRVAREHALGRRLFVGTVDLGSGDLVIWDLTALAADDRPDRVERYRRILLAAASIPTLLPPVEIDGRLHVDGGTREQLFLRRAAGGPPAAGPPRALARALAGPPPCIYVLVNGRLGVPEAEVPGRIVPIAARSLTVLLDEATADNLARVGLLAAELGYAMRVAHLPDRFECESEAADFDLRDMRRMFDLGRELALVGACWAEPAGR